MTERERDRGPFPDHHSSPEGDYSQRDMSRNVNSSVDWGRQELADVLDSESRETRTVAWGDGTVYRVGRDPEIAADLEFFPEAGVARLITQHAEITLFRQAPPSRYRDRIRFEANMPEERIDLTLTRHGRLRLDITPALPGHDLDTPVDTSGTTPPPAHESPALTHPDAAATPLSDTMTTVDITQTRAGIDPDGTQIPLGEETPVLGDSGGAEGHAQEPSTTPEPDQETTTGVDTKPERLNLSGRLSCPPSFRTTRNGTVIGSFPLAVRNDDGPTTWHTVLAFGERAEKLREGVTKEQPLEVIGYLHQRERTLRSGEIKTIAEVSATVIKPR